MNLTGINPRCLERNAAVLKAAGVDLGKHGIAEPKAEPAQEGAGMPQVGAVEGKYRSRWEKEFHVELLERYPKGWIEYEGLSFKLAKRARYTPDFNLVTLGKLTCWEVKGFWREAARVRVKVAARLYPWVRFVVVKKKKKSEGGGWDEEEVVG